MTLTYEPYLKSQALGSKSWFLGSEAAHMQLFPYMAPNAPLSDVDFLTLSK